MERLVGDLVVSDEYQGIGKVYSIDELKNVTKVSFFESPENPNARTITVRLESLQNALLFDETVIYCIHSLHKKWQRARYGGARPNGEHLIIFRRGEDDVVPTSEIYVINLSQEKALDPRAFLSQRCCDTPMFLNHRSNFVNSYIEQRSSCRSISSVLSSGVKLEAYQLAVVRRVLKDDVKKYLLADEVGLGKTIEAGMIIRQLMTDNHSCQAIIAVPESLVRQWTDELTERFFLGKLLGENIVICSHSEIDKELSKLDFPPEIIVIDEAHQIAGRAWSNDSSVNKSFDRIATMCSASEVCLLLSGTPLNGNERNFLAMLHLLSPESYRLDEEGVDSFNMKISQRESLGGIYQALTPNNDNATLSDLLEQIKSIISEDVLLNEFINIAVPLVDWLDGVEDGDERKQSIVNIRNHIGENYRLHQRMLRNRREDNYISSLFPGLSGVHPLIWSVDERSISVEQGLDAYRSEFLSNNVATKCITKKNFGFLVEKAICSPISFFQYLTQILSNCSEEIEIFEREVIEELLDNAKQEQQQKDLVLLNYVQEWLGDNASGKIVVFAGSVDRAMHVISILEFQFGEIIERHKPGYPTKFNSECEIRVLVCDEQGEDGLNLHGGKKLVVHYDLPMSISRIEQRLGRVNRYSADIIASPVQSIVLIPDSQSYSYYWLKILNEDIEVFSTSVASLQYVLEPYIQEAWNETFLKGYDELIFLGKLLQGEKGLIQKEKVKICAQEQLNNLEDEIVKAQEYSALVQNADNYAESQTNEMQGWLTKMLHFKRISGPDSFTYRYKYQAGTLLDCNTFIEKCLLGIDFENSTGESPVTHLMSFDRGVCSHGNNIQPFRYGQPFLDTIYDALENDSRGISAAHVRFLNKGKMAATSFFCIEWLVVHQGENQVVDDELFSPRVIRQWLTPEGKLVSNEKTIAFLDKPYNKSGEFGYKDVNLRTERWVSIEEEFPENEWEALVNSVYQSGREKVNEVLNDNLQFELSIDCISFSVIIVTGS